KEFGAWIKKVHAAKSSGETYALWDEIEQDMIFVGTTGLEDLLQPGVPQAIGNFKAAGIKVWMLTGDKVDTAINVGRNCGLITHEMMEEDRSLFRIEADDDLYYQIQLASDKADINRGS